MDRYDVGQTVGPGLLVLDGQRYVVALKENLSPELQVVPVLTDDQIDDLVLFLEATTDPLATDLRGLIPESVPSGLPVDR